MSAFNRTRFIIVTIIGSAALLYWSSVVVQFHLGTPLMAAAPNAQMVSVDRRLCQDRDDAVDALKSLYATVIGEEPDSSAAVQSISDEVRNRVSQLLKSPSPQPSASRTPTSTRSPSLSNTATPSPLLQRVDRRILVIPADDGIEGASAVSGDDAEEQYHYVIDSSKDSLPSAKVYFTLAEMPDDRRRHWEDALLRTQGHVSSLSEKQSVQTAVHYLLPALDPESTVSARLESSRNVGADNLVTVEWTSFPADERHSCDAESASVPCYVNELLGRTDANLHYDYVVLVHVTHLNNAGFLKNVFAAIERLDTPPRSDRGFGVAGPSCEHPHASKRKSASVRSLQQQLRSMKWDVVPAAHVERFGGRMFPAKLSGGLSYARYWLHYIHFVPGRQVYAIRGFDNDVQCTDDSGDGSTWRLPSVLVRDAAPVFEGGVDIVENAIASKRLPKLWDCAGMKKLLSGSRKDVVLHGQRTSWGKEGLAFATRPSGVQAPFLGAWNRTDEESRVFMYRFLYRDDAERGARAENRTLMTMSVVADDPWMVRLYGWCAQSGEFAAEFLGEGDLTSLPAQHRDAGHRFRWLVDLARSIRGLHRGGRILCDWKPQQWRIGYGRRLKLADIDQTPRWPNHCDEFRYSKDAPSWFLKEMREAAMAVPRGHWSSAAQVPKTSDQSAAFLSSAFVLESESKFPLRDWRFDVWRMLPMLRQLVEEQWPAGAIGQAVRERVYARMLHLERPISTEEMVAELELIAKEFGLSV